MIFKNFYSPALDRIPDRGTLVNLWKQLAPQEVEKVRLSMVQALIKSRTLERFRYKSHYLVAMDGVETNRFKDKHCDHCLHTTTNGQTQYYHRYLEAKIICDKGLVISLGTEFIENTPGEEDKKQDCELKAFYRLSSRLKKDYSRLPIILLMDALFSVGPVFQRCRKNRWHYIITLKDDNLPTVWKEFEALSKIDLNQLLEVVERKKKIKIHKDYWQYQWVNEIDYQGKEFSGKVHVVVAKCWKDSKGSYRKYAFVTLISIKTENVREIITQGRMRWKIENEGFNIQKNSVYGLEHLYTKDPNGMKIVYLLIQVGHMLNQLMVLADLIKAKKRHEIMTVESLVRKLKEAICGLQWDKEIELLWHCLKNHRFQARFDTDP